MAGGNNNSTNPNSSIRSVRLRQRTLALTGGSMSPSSSPGQTQSVRKVSCGKCKSQLVDRVDSSILCDSCGCWFHLKCVDLTRDEAQFVSRLAPRV